MIFGGVVVALGLFGIALVMFPELRTACSGFTKLFIRDRLSTPEGAEAFYTELIDQKTDALSEAHDSYVTIGGKYEQCIKELKNLEAQKKAVERAIDGFLSNGNEEMAGLKNEEWIELDEMIEEGTKNAEELKQLGVDAMEAVNQLEAQLNKLKKEKTRVVSELKSKKQIADAYKSLNGIKDSANDKALEHIREKTKELSARADGERALYNGRTSVKLEKAQREASRLSGGYIGQRQQKALGMNSTGTKFETIKTTEKRKVN